MSGKSETTGVEPVDIDALGADASGFANTLLHVASEGRIWWTSTRTYDDGCFAECVEPHIAAPLCRIVNAAPALIAEVRRLRAMHAAAAAAADDANAQRFRLVHERDTARRALALAADTVEILAGCKGCDRVASSETEAAIADMRAIAEGRS